MKVKEGRKLLEGYSGEELYQQGCKLFHSEVDNLVALRSRGSKPTKGVIESAIIQVKDWFIKVANGLPWSESGIPENIISWESGRIWVKYGIVNPEVERYRDRARGEIMRGTSLPILEALTPEALDTISSMMLAQLQASASLGLKREEFAKRMGERLCPYNEKERFCQYQLTYSMVEAIPLHIEDCAFVCTIDKCYKEK